MHDYDEPLVEERWCAERRADVAHYLQRQGLEHGRIGDWPAWHVAPYISVWAIESASHPDAVGWWAICGDMPTDYISSAGVYHPREALRAFAGEWLEQAELMVNRQEPARIRIGSPADWDTLAPLLKTRASLLQRISEDDDIWQDDATAETV